jgi:DNA polymerase I-like protein with 3'-5' exonuclease and polymerase domains
MLINVDVKGLEVVVAAELSGDKVLKQEIVDKVDIHDANRVAFNLGEGKLGRLVAKIFKFRLIYGGSAYSYANDPDFTGVSDSVKFWEGVIERYYTKYSGVARWHAELLDTVKRTGVIEIPSGRYYPFQAEYRRGDWHWPLTKIKNYPVQGFGADLVMLARIEAYRLLRESGIEFKMIQTIHDSIVVDTPSKNCYTVCMLLKQAVESVPDLVRKHFNYDFSLPLTCEVQTGMNKRYMTEYKFE